MPIAHIIRRVHFSASHRLHNPAKSDEWNRNTYGQCNSCHGHGHNYILEVTLKGPILPDTGYVFDLTIMKQLMQQTIADRCDHKFLNYEVNFLQGIIPSTENLVVAFWKELEPVFPAGLLHCVKLYETERNSAAYYGE
jgi:6-pyruvoyltetrahydropterin/6-carboxytetrahydropterin synthase